MALPCPATHPCLCPGSGQLLTVEELDAADIVWVQVEVLDVAVHGVHQGLADTRVVQAQRMAELMGSNQEEAVT